MVPPVLTRSLAIVPLFRKNRPSLIGHKHCVLPHSNEFHHHKSILGGAFAVAKPVDDIGHSCSD